MASAHAADRFAHPTYTIRKKVLKLFGGAFEVFDPNGQVTFFCEQKAFKLKEDMRVYGDETKAEEVLRIQARSVIDFGAAYDVVDAQTDAKVGALRRSGFKSLVRDEWVILDADDREIGKLEEESPILALVRRFLVSLIPQTYRGTVDGRPAFEFKQHFNPFVLKITLDFSQDSDGLLDRRLGIAAGLLLCAVEDRQGD
jgi:hypothetical protein